LALTIWKQIWRVLGGIFKIKYLSAKKEVEETKHWLRMLSHVILAKDEQLRALWQEAQELTMILQKITSSLRQNHPTNYKID